MKFLSLERVEFGAKPPGILAKYGAASLSICAKFQLLLVYVQYAELSRKAPPIPARIWPVAGHLGRETTSRHQKSKTKKISLIYDHVFYSECADEWSFSYLLT